MWLYHVPLTPFLNKLPELEREFKCQNGQDCLQKSK
jgi:hypothetical protein